MYSKQTMQCAFYIESIQNLYLKKKQFFLFVISTNFLIYHDNVFKIIANLAVIQ